MVSPHTERVERATAQVVAAAKLTVAAFDSLYSPGLCHALANLVEATDELNAARAAVPRPRVRPVAPVTPGTQLRRCAERIAARQASYILSRA